LQEISNCEPDSRKQRAADVYVQQPVGEILST